VSVGGARVRARRGSATRHASEALASAAILERGGAFGACVFSFKKALPHLENKLRTLILCISRSG